MVPLPGSPFASVATRDGRWIFVSLDVPGLTNSSGIAVLQNTGGSIKIAHFIALPRPHTPTGLALTHDERLLVVADGVGISVLATTRMEAGATDALQGSVADGSGAGTIEVTLSRDERYVFATDEYGESLSVINFARLRAGDFSAHAYIGRVLLDLYPVGMALSSDGRYLYITSENSAQATGK
jgi:DNA-binding beta-propeller fold protein YncE